MKIVIIGDGKVGYKLAKQLSEENYDVVLIDNNEEKLKETINKLDINCVTGDGVSVEVQEEAGVPNSDLVIACASTDELNMLSCLIAKRLGAKHTIARVRNPLYFQQIHILKEDLHLSMVINPELTVANEIVRVLIFPSASKVETFVKGKVELVEFPLREGNPIIGMSLAEVYKKFQIKILVCAVQRGKEVYIPDGSFVPQIGDKLHVAASHKQLEALFTALGNKKKLIRKVMIGGGGRASFYLAKQLTTMGMEVKIIEHNRKKCEDLCEQLPKATIIYGDATDHELLLEEGINEADAYVALTGLDEENIITGLFAKGQGVHKIVAKVNEDSRAQMVEGLGIDSLVSAKSATADAIISYVRARQNSYSSANVETMYRLVDDRVEALEFIIKEETSYTHVPLKDLRTKPNNLIACIARNRQIIIPSGNDFLQVGDSVVVVTRDKKVQDIQDILV
ncbi:MAG: Trk system potassium transporter TrkA [Tyzzerella sp.]|nr:Trk system potassium transporter TrkA [Tyzzerella sp.]